MKNLLAGLLAGLLLALPVGAIAEGARTTPPAQPHVTTAMRCHDLAGTTETTCRWHVRVRPTDRSPMTVRVRGWVCRTTPKHERLVTRCARR